MNLGAMETAAEISRRLFGPQPPTVREYFAPGGPLARIFPTYRPRQGQIDLAEAMEANAGKGGVLLAEGPCGIGKTGSAICALGRRALAGERALISTATLNLQDQYINKDLPLFCGAFGGVRQITFAVLKGRANYVCRRKAERTGYLPDGFWTWAEETTADRAELGGLRVDWPAISTTAQECLRDACRMFDVCYTNRARRRAVRADVVVTNHMLLSLSLARPSILPEPVADPRRRIRHVVVDEAHDFEDYFRRALGWERSFGSFKRWHREHEDLEVSCQWADAALEGARALFGGYDRALGRRDALRVPPAEPPPLGQILDALREGAADLDAASAAFIMDDRDEAAARASRLAEWAAETRVYLAQAHRHRPPDMIGWISREERRGGRGKPRVLLSGVPIDVSPMARSLLTSFGSAALMSATLDIPAARRDLGLEAAREATVPSPFDWPAKALLCVPATMPAQPKGVHGQERARAVDAVREANGVHLRWLAERTGGGVLGLFASTDAARAARDFLRRYPLSPPVTVFLQGEGGSRAELIEAFKADRDSILLGVKSFWQGVDAPGPTLRAVLIDKLPLTPPGDVVEKAIEGSVEARTGQRGFFARSLPRALVALRQAIGRLIRDVDDLGVVLVLDRRAAVGGSSYWRTVQGAFPPGVPYTEDLEVVERWIKERMR